MTVSCLMVHGDPRLLYLSWLHTHVGCSFYGLANSHFLFVYSAGEVITVKTTRLGFCLCGILHSHGCKLYRICYRPSCQAELREAREGC